MAAAITVAFNFADLRDRIIGPVEPPRIESLAVLPLRNLSGDPGEEYLVDGMTESLIASLAQVESLQVISRTTIMKYKDSMNDVPEIARELRVDAVVEGSVLHANGKVRITGQLIHAPTDRLLWAESYEGDMRDVIALQNQVAHAIVDGIQHTLTPGQRTRLTSMPVVNPEAYDAYLKGRYYYWKFESADTLNKAVQYFEQAIELDPTFAPAYLGLADSYSMLALEGIVPAKDVYPLAKQAAEEALALDGNLGEAYATLSHIRVFYDWDWEGAENAWEKALELAPSGRKARTARLNYLVAMGEFDEALREQEKIMQLDAVRPVNDRNYGVICSYARQYERANNYYEKSLEFYDVPNVRIWMASNLVHESKIDEALKALQRAIEMHPLFEESFFDLHVAYVYAAMGDRQQALKILEYWKKQRSLDELSQSSLAAIYAALGEKDMALDRLERAFEQRCPGLIYLKVDSVFDPIRSEPRFQEMVSRMNFPS
jgi:TolB-like protein/Tfp pilus assembly protein PilF